MIQEEFLHYLWQHQLYNRNDLLTAKGEPLEILYPGSLNKDSGPDFFNAKIRIRDILWVGNLEVHIKSSDWFKHQHQNDPAYSKLILHVVWEHDREVHMDNGSTLDVLVLKGRVKKKLIEEYIRLLSSKGWIPCASNILKVEGIHIRNMLDRMAYERLEQKAERIKQLLYLHKNDWERVFYQLTARAFGFKVNALPFELLAVNTPFQLVRKYRNSLLKLEALLFGQAGFLEDTPSDAYQTELGAEYKYLKKLHHLQAIDRSLWKFMRMRPSNFPTIRIAQWAALLHQNSRPFIGIQNSPELSAIRSVFRAQPSSYWPSHYDFGKKDPSPSRKIMGEASIDILIINVVVPLLFSWMKEHSYHDPHTSLNILDQIPAERNKYVRQWEKMGIQLRSAADSQACLQLKMHHCELKKCLNCTIGNAIIKN